MSPPTIGSDEWVARSEERLEGPAGRLRPLLVLWDRAGWPGRLAVAVGLVALFGALVSSDYLLRVGINTMLLAILALGLNVVVGWAGLLDLGYIAFYGFGAYLYSLLSSDQLGGGVHLSSWASIPAVIVATALVGLLLGLPSRRLLGDYLAIVTLFFGLVFVQLVTNLDRVTLPGSDHPISLTGGPNGITGVDPISLFGHDLISSRSYFFLLLVVGALVMACLYPLNSSRTGRAWRAVREDPLAAQLMTIPVNRVKLLAFSVGAAFAGLSGAIFAAVQAGVYPQNFDTPFLILIYAAVILGGSGSIAGSVIGAVIVSVTLELLRNPTEAGYMFYGLILLTLVARLRPWRALGAVLGGTVALGLVVHAVVGAISSSAVAGSPSSGGWLSEAIGAWVVIPANGTTAGNIAFVALVVALIAMVHLPGRHRLWAMPGLLYLAAFVWENRLVVEPSITRQILLGALLIVMMLARPYGLLGERRVERM
jgi:branched-chain amino acid transport system permease protein